MYNPKKRPYKDNDIAILKLKSSLTFNKNVQPACLPYPSVMPENTGFLTRKFIIVCQEGHETVFCLVGARNINSSAIYELNI